MIGFTTAWNPCPLFCKCQRYAWVLCNSKHMESNVHRKSSQWWFKQCSNSIMTDYVNPHNGLLVTEATFTLDCYLVQTCTDSSRLMFFCSKKWSSFSSHADFKFKHGWLFSASNGIQFRHVAIPIFHNIEKEAWLDQDSFKFWKTATSLYHK